MSDDVNARIEQLEAEVRELRAQVAQDRAEPTPAPDRRLSRRALLGGAAAAGAGIVGAALSAVPAGATTDFMLYGSPNDAGTDNTSLTSTNGTTLILQNGTSTKVPLNLAPSAIAGPPASGSQNKGDLFVGSTGQIFICIASGTPGTWRPLAQVGATNSEISANTTIFQNNAAPAVEVTAAGTANVAPLRIVPSLSSGSPTGPHSRGEVYIDSAGKIYLCTADGTPGTWRTLAQVGGSNSDIFGFPTVFTNSSTAAIQTSAGGAVDVPPLFIAPSLNAGAPAANSHGLGEVHIDSAGVMYTCIEAGNPGKWARHAPLVVLPSPIRVYDSRVGQPNPSGSPQGALALGATRTINCSPAVTGAPLVSALLMNLTVTNTVGAKGALTVFSAAVAAPSTSSINWAAVNTAVANAVTSACDSSQDIKVKCVSGTSTQFIIDVIGYY